LEPGSSRKDCAGNQIALMEGASKMQQGPDYGLMKQPSVSIILFVKTVRKLDAMRC